MNLNQFLCSPDEKPLDRIPDDGGFCGIFRTIGCIGDSLASGEFESTDENGEVGYHDYFDYSWIQYIARAAGLKACNFSSGGMTAKEYWDSFAEKNCFWDRSKLCQAYILALGVNDLFAMKQPLGSVQDIDRENYENNADTFAGYYAKIIQRLKTMQPKARFFLVTMPRENDTQHDAVTEKHAQLLAAMADFFEYTYVIDLRTYGPVYDSDFRKKFFLGGHMNPAGYLLSGRMIAAYIDYIVRHNMEDFAQIGFIGTDFHNRTAKW